MSFYSTAVQRYGGADTKREPNAFFGLNWVLGVERQLVAEGARRVWGICHCASECSPRLCLSGWRTDGL